MPMQTMTSNWVALGDGETAAQPYVYHEPTQKPTTPAYRAFLETRAADGRRLVLDNKKH